MILSRGTAGRRPLFSRHALPLLVAGAISLPAQALSTVDLLIVYDTYTKSYFSNQPDTAIRNWVSQVNTAYQNSGIEIRVRLVGTLQRDIAGSSMQQVLPTLRTDATVAAKRQAVGADYVSMLSRTGNCGLGYLAINGGWVHSVVGPQCGPLTLAHELGHTMGLNHSRRQGDSGGTHFAYGLGHGVDGNFGTIMSYAHLFGVSRTPKFSNPLVTCPGGLPCGVPEGEPLQADSAKAINRVQNTISTFFPTRVFAGLPVADSTPTDNRVPLVNNAIYTLKASHSGRCMTVSNASKAANANVVQWACSNSTNQRWVALDAGSQYYRLKAQHSNLCLQVAGVGSAQGAVLQQAACVNNDSQHWSLVKNANGTIRLTYRRSNLVADIESRGVANGPRLVQRTLVDVPSMKWTVDRL